LISFLPFRSFPDYVVHWWAACVHHLRTTDFDAGVVHSFVVPFLLRLIFTPRIHVTGTGAFHFLHPAFLGTFPPHHHSVYHSGNTDTLFYLRSRSPPLFILPRYRSRSLPFLVTVRFWWCTVVLRIRSRVAFVQRATDFVWVHSEFDLPFVTRSPLHTTHLPIRYWGVTYRFHSTAPAPTVRFGAVRYRSTACYMPVHYHHTIPACYSVWSLLPRSTRWYICSEFEVVVIFSCSYISLPFDRSTFHVRLHYILRTDTIRWFYFGLRFTGYVIHITDYAKRTFRSGIPDLYVSRPFYIRSHSVFLLFDVYRLMFYLNFGLPRFVTDFLHRLRYGGCICYNLPFSPPNFTVPITNYRRNDSTVTRFCAILLATPFFTRFYRSFTCTTGTGCYLTFCTTVSTCDAPATLVTPPPLIVLCVYRFSLLPLPFIRSVRYSAPFITGSFVIRFILVHVSLRLVTFWFDYDSTFCDTTAARYYRSPHLFTLPFYVVTTFTTFIFTVLESLTLLIRCLPVWNFCLRCLSSLIFSPITTFSGTTCSTFLGPCTTPFPIWTTTDFLRDYHQPDYLFLPFTTAHSFSVSLCLVPVLAVWIHHNSALLPFTVISSTVLPLFLFSFVIYIRSLFTTILPAVSRYSFRFCSFTVGGARALFRFTAHLYSIEFVLVWVGLFLFVVRSRFILPPPRCSVSVPVLPFVQFAFHTAFYRLHFVPYLVLPFYCLLNYRFTTVCYPAVYSTFSALRFVLIRSTGFWFWVSTGYWCLRFCTVYHYRLRLHTCTILPTDAFGLTFRYGDLPFYTVPRTLPIYRYHYVTHHLPHLRHVLPTRTTVTFLLLHMHLLDIPATLYFPFTFLTPCSFVLPILFIPFRKKSATLRYDCVFLWVLRFVCAFRFDSTLRSDPPRSGNFIHRFRSFYPQLPGVTFLIVDCSDCYLRLEPFVLGVPLFDTFVLIHILLFTTIPPPLFYILHSFTIFDSTI